MLTCEEFNDVTEKIYTFHTKRDENWFQFFEMTLDKTKN